MTFEEIVEFANAVGSGREVGRVKIKLPPHATLYGVTVRPSGMVALSFCFGERFDHEHQVAYVTPEALFAALGEVRPRHQKDYALAVWDALGFGDAYLAYRKRWYGERK